MRGHSDAVTGPVVVGVDGSALSATALRLAFEAAAARGADLVAVRAYVPLAQAVVPRDAQEAAERDALQSSLAGWREQYPSVKVEALLAVGRATKVLIGMTHAAQLVVVGSRGHGGFTGLLLGSVGQQLMHYAECPVLVADAPAATERAASTRSASVACHGAAVAADRGSAAVGAPPGRRVSPAR